jgi:hypothetical protein
MESKENIQKEESWMPFIIGTSIGIVGVSLGMYYYDKSKRVKMLLRLWDSRAEDKGVRYDGGYMRKELKKLTLWDLTKLRSHQRLNQISYRRWQSSLSKSEAKSKAEGEKEKHRKWFKESNIEEKIDLSPVEKIGVLSH